jgi:hypothetical protein
MTDAKLVLQVETTKTASFTSTFQQAGPTPTRKPMYAHVIYKDAGTSAGSGTVTFSVEESDDSVTFTTHQTAQALTINTTTGRGVISIPILGGKKYLRLRQVMAGGTTPTITYSAYIGYTEVP